ncbi:MAG TPA: ATP-binding protein [Verrucomicrobiae bacterium]|nr:ATP-binding protein [Verrucomicrobiae bacterium]
MRNRIFLKMMVALVMVIALAALILDISIRYTWTNSLSSDIQRLLTQNAQSFALRIQNDRVHSLQQMADEESHITGMRATIIARDGTVLADSEANPSTMENHAGRPEVQTALQGATGSSTRVSKTVGVEFLYVAVPSGDKIARLAFPLASIRDHVVQIRKTLLAATIASLVLALLVALLVARNVSMRLRNIVRFAEQMAAGDLSARIAEDRSDEIGQVAVALDRTGRRLEANFAAIRESRSELEALLNSMKDGVIAVSHDLRILWANQAISEIVHRPVRIGAPVTELVRHPDFLATIRTAVHGRQRQTTIASSLAGSKSFSITAEPLPDGGVVSVLHDISEIERVEKTRRDFIANVSHELRTPLTSIRGYAETLLESGEPLSGHTQEFMQVIRRNAERMGRLTEDLLVLARVESGEEKLDLRPHQVHQLIAEAASAMQKSAEAEGVELSVGEAPEASVVADSYAVHQVFANLISNALRYAQSGKKIVIGATEKPPRIEFFVSDSGPGIPSEHLPRIFERFYRVDKARSRETGGTGLGLAIVKHIVLNHGGTVRVESVVGHGSTFFFTLPKA